MKVQPFEIREPASFRYIERGLIGFAVLLITFALYLLASGVSLRSWLLGWQDESGGVPVGEVARIDGEVRRKAADGLEFTKSTASETVYNYDTVITGAGSGTTLRMKDGSEIELGPKTMVRIFYEDTAGITGVKRLAGINVLSGEIKAKDPKASIKVVANGERLDLTKTPTVKVAAPTLEKIFQRPLPELEVLRKDMTTPKVVSTPKGPREPQVRIITPMPNAQYRPVAQNFNPKQVIPFQWTQTPKEVPTTVELYYLGLARTPGVEPRLVLSKTVESGVESRKFNLIVDRPGVYEWRMNLPATELNKAKTLAQTFQVSRFVEMIDLQMPQLDATSSAFTGKHLDDFNVAFRWKPIPNAEGYTLKVYADPALQRPIYEKEINSNVGEARNDNLIKGSQYFLVQAKLPNGYIATSRVGKIGFDFVPPVLAFPKDASQFQKAQLTKEKNQIVFTWRKTNFTEHYSFQISTSPRFDRVVYEVRPDGNFTVVKKDLPKGIYYWRVRSVGKTTSSDPSKPNRFEIK